MHITIENQTTSHISKYVLYEENALISDLFVDKLLRRHKDKMTVDKLSLWLSSQGKEKLGKRTCSSQSKNVSLIELPSLDSFLQKKSPAFMRIENLWPYITFISLKVYLNCKKKKAYPG